MGFAGLLGDGRFGEAFDPLPPGDVVERPFVLDYDSDGADDLIAGIDGGAQITGSTGMLYHWYPSPLALYGIDGALVAAGSLPEPQRGPELQYGVARPHAADLGVEFEDVDRDRIEAIDLDRRRGVHEGREARGLADRRRFGGNAKRIGSLGPPRGSSLPHASTHASATNRRSLDRPPPTYS